MSKKKSERKKRRTVTNRIVPIPLINWLVPSLTRACLGKSSNHATSVGYDLFSEYFLQDSVINAVSPAFPSVCCVCFCCGLWASVDGWTFSDPHGSAMS